MFWVLDVLAVLETVINAAGNGCFLMKWDSRTREGPRYSISRYSSICHRPPPAVCLYVQYSTVQYCTVLYMHTYSTDCNLHSAVPKRVLWVSPVGEMVKTGLEIGLKSVCLSTRCASAKYGWWFAHASAITRDIVIAIT